MDIWANNIPKEIKIDYFSSKNIKDFLLLWEENEFNINRLEDDNNHLRPPFRFLIPFLKDNKNQTPIRSIFTCVADHYSAFALIEEPYLDLEFWDSYSGFYSYSFSQYQIAGKRIHFFKGDENNSDQLLKYLYEGETKQKIKMDLDISWIGYCNLRPIHSFIVGRTALRFDDQPIDEMSEKVTKFTEEKGGKPYLKATSQCTVNILNTHFSINTPEFIQQDPNIGQCATASLWVANKILAEKFGTNRLFFRSITKQAVGQWNRELEVKLNDEALTFTEDGTTVAEIKNALSATGVRILSFAQSEVESINTSFIRLTNEIYSFVESGYPVLLCINKNGQRHVVTVVAHCLPKVEHMNFPSISPLVPSSNYTSISTAYNEKHYLIGNRVNVYYCHDDAYGPFNRICLIKNNPKKRITQFNGIFCKNKKIKKEYIDPSVMLEMGRDRKKYDLEYVIIPVHPYVKTSSTEPFKSLVSWFNDNFAYKYRNKVFLWRSLLIQGSDFKISIVGRCYDKEIVKWYSTLHLPKYVWLFELSILERYKINEYFYHPSFEARYISGEFLFDATVSDYSPRMISGRASMSYTDYSTKSYCIGDSIQLLNFKGLDDVPEYGCYIQNMVDEIKNES